MRYYDFMFNNIVEVKMNDKELTYTIILPGVAKSDVSVTISNNNLRIETTKKTAFGERFIYNDEYNYSKKYVVEKATSKLLDGVLTITIPAKQFKQEKLISHKLNIE